MSELKGNEASKQATITETYFKRFADRISEVNSLLDEACSLQESVHLRLAKVYANYESGDKMAPEPELVQKSIDETNSLSNNLSYGLDEIEGIRIRVVASNNFLRQELNNISEFI